MNILFVCTGNTCRSPMAQGVFRKILIDKGIDGTTTLSAGISADNKSKATENAIKACRAIDVDLSNHISKNIFDMDVSNIDKFVVMTDLHRDILSSLGIDINKIYVLGNQIQDPYGGDISVYEKCRDQIYHALCKFYDECCNKGK